ncbi:MAG: hypothetical protein HOM25_08680 [Rhodospirillaceae bacterium]|jgi:hypothetical protein|nr:hypothetical protein [Rhodospirillaceae bacterium]
MLEVLLPTIMDRRTPSARRSEYVLVRGATYHRVIPGDGGVLFERAHGCGGFYRGQG